MSQMQQIRRIPSLVRFACFFLGGAHPKILSAMFVLQGGDDSSDDDDDDGPAAAAGGGDDSDDDLDIDDI